MIKEAESGIPVPEIFRKHGIAQSTFYKWRSKYGGIVAIRAVAHKLARAAYYMIKNNGPFDVNKACA